MRPQNARTGRTPTPRNIAAPVRITVASPSGTNDRVISVLIPALNEADYVRSVVRRAASVLPGHEVLVIDGGSTDATAVAATSEGATVVRSSGSRGSSLNVAARLARGDVLLFLHADTLLPPDAEAEILRVLRDTRVVGGAFRMAFDDSSAVARWIAGWVNVRSR